LSSSSVVVVVPVVVVVVLVEVVVVCVVVVVVCVVVVGRWVVPWAPAFGFFAAFFLTVLQVLAARFLTACVFAERARHFWP
jgi:hypothetical protein